MNDITQTKLIASLVLFVITLLFGYLPVRIILNQNYIQHAMFAGGGVLMATAFCHLIPEAHDGYKNLNNGGHGTTHSHNHNPLTAEEDDHHHHHHQHNNSVIENINNHNETITTSATLLANNATTKTTLTDSSNNNNNNNNTIINNNNNIVANTFQHLFHHDSNSVPSHSVYVPYPEIALCCGFIFMYVVEQLFLRFVNNHTHEHPGGDTSTGQLIVGPQPKGSSTGNDSVAAEFDGEHPPGDQSVVVIDGSVSELASVNGRHPKSSTPSGTANTSGAFYKFIRGLLIVSAFSLHSIFDGVAIGSQDSIEKVWTIFFAISCHKLIIVAVVGFELFSATLESHLWTLIHLTVFSIMSPVGILLVVVAQSSFKISSDDPAIILLQSFATGTLLYIIFVEILQPKEDRFHARNRSTKILSLILGFAAMVTILTLMHEH